MEIKLSEKTVNAILQVLGNLPYVQVAQVISQINKEIVEQQKGDIKND